MFTRLNTFIPQQACSLFEPFQLPGEHATLAAISALLGSSIHITILPLMPGPLFTAVWLIMNSLFFRVYSIAQASVFENLDIKVQ